MHCRNNSNAPITTVAIVDRQGTLGMPDYLGAVVPVTIAPGAIAEIFSTEERSMYVPHTDFRINSASPQWLEIMSKQLSMSDARIIPCSETGGSLPTSFAQFCGSYPER